MHSIRLQVHDGPQLTTFLEYKYFYVFLEVQNISLKESLCLDIQFASVLNEVNYLVQIYSPT